MRLVTKDILRKICRCFYHILYNIAKNTQNQGIIFMQCVIGKAVKTKNKKNYNKKRLTHYGIFFYTDRQEKKEVCSDGGNQAFL